MTCTKNKADCVLETPVAHVNCITSGSNRCQDSLHHKEHWTRDDLDLLDTILEHYGEKE